MSPVQVLAPKGPFPHYWQWVYDPALGDTTVYFRLKCSVCGSVGALVGFDWIGSDGPALGEVLREFERRADRSRAELDQLCPGTKKP